MISRWAMFLIPSKEGMKLYIWVRDSSSAHPSSALVVEIKFELEGGLSSALKPLLHAIAGDVAK